MYHFISHKLNDKSAKKHTAHKREEDPLVLEFTVTYYVCNRDKCEGGRK